MISVRFVKKLFPILTGIVGNPSGDIVPFLVRELGLIWRDTETSHGKIKGLKDNDLAHTGVNIMA